MFSACPPVTDIYTVLFLGTLLAFVPYGFLKQKAIWTASLCTALLVQKLKKSLSKGPLKRGQYMKEMLPLPSIFSISQL